MRRGAQAARWDYERLPVEERRKLAAKKTQDEYLASLTPEQRLEVEEKYAEFKKERDYQHSLPEVEYKCYSMLKTQASLELHLTKINLALQDPEIAAVIEKVQQDNAARVR